MSTDSPSGMLQHGPRTLANLIRRATVASISNGADSVQIRGITDDSREVESGSLYVAVPGTRVDGHDFVADAVRRGAAAVVVERDVDAPVETPVVYVPDARIALAEMAAAWHGFPAERLRLVGITGTVGKTSVLAMLEAILQQSGIHSASIGSLGVRIGHEAEETGYTAPDALRLQEALAGVVSAGGPLTAMEVTSHALDQGRVHGLRFDLGVFTNLVPLEHADYHGSFRGYVEVKSRFFDHLRSGAPVVHSADDRSVRRLVGERDVDPIPCGTGRSALVRAEDIETSVEGTRFHVQVRRPLSRLAGDPLPPIAIPVTMPILGRANVINAVLSATAGLCLGADPEAIPEALADTEPARRRMEILHRGRFTVLDDTVGHPESVSAVFEVVEALAPRRLHAVVGVRGSRGTEVNRQLAGALAIWARKRPPTTLLVTTSEDAADERNRVEPDERDAFLAPLREEGVSFEERSTVEAAVPEVLQAAGEGDLVLLLGAQGMDAAAAEMHRWLESSSES